MNALSCTPSLRLTGSEGTLYVGGRGQHLTIRWERFAKSEDAVHGATETVVEEWETARTGGSSMDRCVEEMVVALGTDAPTEAFATDPAAGLHTLEVILGIMASSEAGGDWKSLPLQGGDRGLELRAG